MCIQASNHNNSGVRVCVGGCACEGLGPLSQRSLSSIQSVKRPVHLPHNPPKNSTPIQFSTIKERQLKNRRSPQNKSNQEIKTEITASVFAVQQCLGYLQYIPRVLTVPSIGQSVVSSQLSGLQCRP